MQNDTCSSCNSLMRKCLDQIEVMQAERLDGIPNKLLEMTTERMTNSKNDPASENLVTATMNSCAHE